MEESSRAPQPAGTSASDGRVDCMRPDDNVLLLTQMDLPEYLRFVRTNAFAGRMIPETALVSDWMRASQTMAELLHRESGIADGPAATALPAELDDEGEAALRQPALQSALLHTPSRWAMVELDRLVIFQKRINLARVKEIQRELPESPSVRDLFRLAAGNPTTPDVIEATQIREGIFSFSCRRPYADIRPLHVGILSNDLQSIHLRVPGAMLSVVGVVMGAPVSSMSALEIGGRLVLCNGTHRAYAVRELGVTHMPCLLRAVANEALLDVVAPADIARNRPQYLRSARPPVFKDYLDERLCKLLGTIPYRSLWHVQVSVHESRTPVW